MRKRIFCAFCASCLAALLASGVPAAHGALTDNLDGTVTQERIDGSMLMWLKDANYAETSGYDSDGRMSWDDATTWIDTLNSSDYLGYNDWRLPETGPVNGSTYNISYLHDGSSDRGSNISAPDTVYAGSTESEMAYMFYYELGNPGYYDTSGSGPQDGWGLTNTDIFTNLQPRHYWSGTEYVQDPEGAAWEFYFQHGIQNAYNRPDDFYGWAVRTIPEPLPSISFGGLALLAGLVLGIAGWARRR